MKFEDRYASAVRSSNLRSEAKTLNSSIDIIGAAGMAGKRHRLAMALFRLLTSDNREISTVVDLVAQKIITKAYRTGSEIRPLAAHLMASILVSHARDPRCKTCGGHGFMRYIGTPHLDKGMRCMTCNGQGKWILEDSFSPERLQLALWCAAELERELERAAPAAMAALSLNMSYSRSSVLR